ncbi:MAG: signal peptidase I [Candidatus Eremiobacteraeota bacterium]|nr:signal peptidase I [Candidatus Eremiobacteraeota bacterium]MBV8222418.1 signal peptidase I [Candidatus Eremiobacteraeota bacterium]
MSPGALFLIIGLLLVARVVIGVRPVTVPDEKQRMVVREYLDAFIVAGVVALVLMQFVVRTFWIPSGSMEPTLDINDVLLANELQYRFSNPKDGQIAVFAPPPQLGTTDFIKRVMAVPGDTFRVKDGDVYRNGVKLDEPYVAKAARPSYDLEIKDYDIYVDGMPLNPERSQMPPKSAWQAPDRVPNGYYLMLGDNRNDSNDSHLWGFLRRDQFVGHAFFVFWPPKHAGTLK